MVPEAGRGRQAASSARHLHFHQGCSSLSMRQQCPGDPGGELQAPKRILLASSWAGHCQVQGERRLGAKRWFTVGACVLSCPSEMKQRTEDSPECPCDAWSAGPPPSSDSVYKEAGIIIHTVKTPAALRDGTVESAAGTEPEAGHADRHMSCAALKSHPHESDLPGAFGS